MLQSPFSILTIIILWLCNLYHIDSFTVPGNDPAPSRNSGGAANYRNEDEDLSSMIDLQQIQLDQKLQKTMTDSTPEKKQTKLRKVTYHHQVESFPLNPNSTIHLKLSELSEWANQGNGAKAETILWSLEQEGKVPSKLAYLATIRAWLSKDCVQEALYVMARLEASKTFDVQAADYRPILQTFIRNGDRNNAVRLINHMSKCTTGRPILKDYDFEDPKRKNPIWTTLSCSELPDERCLMIVCNEFVKKRLPDRQSVVCTIYEWAKAYHRADNYLLTVALTALDDPRDREKFLLLHCDTDTHAICYMTVMQAYAATSSGKHGKNMKRQQQQQRQQHDIVIHQRGEKMESLLRRIEAASAGGAIQPDLVTYRQIMEAYLEDHNAVKALQFLQKTFNDVQSGRIKDSLQSFDMFVSWSKTVIDLMAKSTILNVKKTQAILSVIQWMEQFSDHKGQRLNIEFYHFVMDNYIRAKGNDSVFFVELIYARLQERYRTLRDPELAPNTKTLNIVLKAFSKSKDKTNMEKAEGILSRMEEAYYQKINVAKRIIPDVVSYSTLIQGWASCQCPDAIIRADGIVKRLHTMYESGNDAAKPDAAVQLAIRKVVALSSSSSSHHDSDSDGHSDADSIKDEKDSPYDTRLSLQYLIHPEEKPPDLISLTKLIQERKTSDAGETAEYILDRLLKMYESSQSQQHLPDGQLFASAITAWSRSLRPDAARRAERILDTMMLLYDLTKSEKVKPNHHHFVAVIRAYSQPNQPDKAENAIRILQQMISLHEDQIFFGSHPNPHGFRDALVAVLKACSHSKGLSYDKQRELAIVQRIQDMIRNGTFGVRPNEVTYGAYMGAIRNCMARGMERTILLQEAFEQCSSEGYIDVFVLGQLRRSVSATEFQDLLGRMGMEEPTTTGSKSSTTTATSRALEMQHIPSYWRRNIMTKRV